MFGEIVTKIGKARPTIDLKMVLSHTILDPIIPHESRDFGIGICMTVI